MGTHFHWGPFVRTLFAQRERIVNVHPEQKACAVDSTSEGNVAHPPESGLVGRINRTVFADNCSSFLRHFDFGNPPITPAIVVPRT